MLCVCACVYENVWANTQANLHAEKKWKDGFFKGNNEFLIKPELLEIDL